jgi:hypothetical protein
MLPANKIASIGDNNPPNDAESLTIALCDNHRVALDHAQELVEQSKNISDEIRNDDAADRASDLIKLIMSRKKTLETARVAEKEPYLSLGRVVDGFFKRPMEALDAAHAKAKRPLDVYLKEKAAKEQRRLREEAEAARQLAEEQRLAESALAKANQTEAAAVFEEKAAITTQAAEKLEAKAEARPAELSRTRSAQGALASLRTTWQCTSFDPATLDLEKLRHHFGDAALKSACNSYVKAGGRVLIGATIEEISETVVR